MHILSILLNKNVHDIRKDITHRNVQGPFVQGHVRTGWTVKAQRSGSLWHTDSCGVDLAGVSLSAAHTPVSSLRTITYLVVVTLLFSFSLLPETRVRCCLILLPFDYTAYRSGRLRHAAAHLFHSPRSH